MQIYIKLLVALFFFATILTFCYESVYASDQKVKAKVGSMNEPSSTRVPATITPVVDPECTVLAPGDIAQERWTVAQKQELEEANLLQAAKHPELALARYKNLNHSIESFEIAYNYGVTLAATGRLTEAEEALNKAVLLDPQFKVAYKLLSLVQQSLKKDREAKLNMDRYLQL